MAAMSASAAIPFAERACQFCRWSRMSLLPLGFSKTRSSAALAPLLQPRFGSVVSRLVCAGPQSCVLGCSNVRAAAGARPGTVDSGACHVV